MPAPCDLAYKAGIRGVMAAMPSPRLSPFEAVKDALTHLAPMGENMVDCCNILPRRMRLQRVHEYLTSLLQQGFPTSDSLTSISVYLRVRGLKHVRFCIRTEVSSSGFDVTASWLAFMLWCTQRNPIVVDGVNRIEFAKFVN
ncbi:hypothetical protein BV898_05508 [Hypsibius exemplaris]|uniref:Uncharacterized protein n=1 Tax=Hypsibius exemplaris TaxID=2072580 RepID=A0A1W0WZ42_HYPEX|nr:hypothetical protein BV898_05508 [Hypsibius exemplaris]